MFPHFDPILEAAYAFSSVNADLKVIQETTRQVLAEPEFSGLAPNQNGPGPMILHAGGGIRTSATSIVKGLLSGAFLRIYFLRLPCNENCFVRTVLESFEELRRAVKGEKIHTYLVTGISGIQLPDENKVTTPWGTLLRAPPMADCENFFFLVHNSSITTCVLAESRLLL